MAESKKGYPELIAPVQDWNVLKMVKDFSDAIFFGVKKYNMRLKATNFKREDLEKVCDFCHSQNPEIKAYLCTNILIYNSEIKDLKNLISNAKDAGIDAIIAHDIAAINIAKKMKVRFHISTQANISNIESAKFFESLGADRIILARELSLKQISQIKSQLKRTKIECFVHGSMCSSISGRCYLSATICKSEEFSANRGKCVQPCRRRWTVFDDEKNEFIYDGQMFLNAKDLCMIEYIPALIQSRIDAFKIEGRMKDPNYTATVVKCYREAIDSYYEGTYNQDKINRWLKKLSSVYNRGFHTGFYFRRPTIENNEINLRGNISSYKKYYIGKILSFHSPSSTANIIIEKKNFPIKNGMQIIITGSDSYLIDSLKNLMLKGKKINEIIRKPTEKPLILNIKLNKKVKENDKIYIISKM
ncbi:MAG: peptidase U32 family protein [Promethearchaeota archaeon]